jgi:hypothetical protein
MRPYSILLAAGICLVSSSLDLSAASSRDLADKVGHRDGRALATGRINPAPVPAEVVVADEICDGLDQDGDGEIDEGLTRPCSNACGSGTETCATGEWTSCSARPCCDITVGPGLPASTLCPTAETASATVCLLPGSYAVDAGCVVRSSLIGLGDPGQVIIEGDLLLSGGPARIQGITITGSFRSKKPLDLLENRMLGGLFTDGRDEEGAPGTHLYLVAHNEVHNGLVVSFPTFVHANEITPSLGLGDDAARHQVATENRIVGPQSTGVLVSDALDAYLAGNVIEDVDVGIRIPCYIEQARIVANRVVAHSVGVDACSEGGDGISLLRNDISYGGVAGAIVRSDTLRIEGNLIVRDPGASPSPDSGGVLARVLPPEGCSPCLASLRDNTIVGGTFYGMVVDHEIGTGPAVVAGNIIVGGTDTGVLICSRDGCPSSPLFAITATNNDVQAGRALWSGTADPTGTNGNISADPEFVDPAARDFRLAEGSPCRDAGTPGNLLVDLVGRARSLDGDGDGTAIPDMGALEAGSSCHDADADGFGAPGDLDCPGGTETDCDDTNPDVFPGAVDLPGNSVNESCDGAPAACDPDRPEGWRNHGQYVRCVAQTVATLVGQDRISSADGEALVRTAARSSVGK